MSSIRQNPISGDWVIVAEQRAERPQPAREVSVLLNADDCPFCAGHEAETPAAVLQLPAPPADWQVRVVPNKYPALLAADAIPTPESERSAGELAPVGAHEVVIESRRHIARTAELTVDELLLVLQAFRERMRIHYADPVVRYVQAFKNVGPTSGATLEHAHAQIVGLPLVPPRVATRLACCAEWHREQGSCLVCAEIEREQQATERVVYDSQDMIAFCPAAARVPCETWIVPRTHRSRYDQADDALLADLAATTLNVCRRVDTALGAPDYNLVLQSAPADDLHADSYHWHLEMIPRATRLAGFEWGSGCYINPLAPEQAAKALRSDLDASSG